MIPFSKVMAELVSIGANLTQALTQRFHRLKMQDRIDRLDAGKPGLQRLSRALRAAERVYPLTAVAAKAACSASDQGGPASSGQPKRAKLAPMGLVPALRVLLASPSYPPPHASEGREEKPGDKREHDDNGCDSFSRNMPCRVRAAFRDVM